MADRVNVYPAEKKITLHFHQSEIMRSKARYLGFIGGTGSGKTFTGPIWLRQEIEKYPTDDFMLVAPVSKMLWSRSLPALEEYFSKAGVIYDFKEQKGEVQLETGGKVYIRSADNPETLEGPTLRAVWADEAGQMKRKTWRILQRRVGLLKGKILLTTTPYLMNWLYKDVLKRFEERDKDYFCVQLSSIQNPFYPKDEYYARKKELSPEEFAMFYDGKFIHKSGLVYKEFTEDMVIEPFEIPLDWRMGAGIDWGFNHPFVFSLWAIDEKTGINYNCGEYYQKEKGLAYHALEIKKLVGDRSVIAYYDPENPQAAQDMKDELCRIDYHNVILRPAQREGKTWVNDGIRYVKSLMWQGKYRVFNTCKHNLDEKKIYHWLARPDGVDYMDSPAKKDDDAQSAERYYLYSDRKTRLQFYIV